MPVEKKHYKACYSLKNSATNKFNDENWLGEGGTILGKIRKPKKIIFLKLI